MFNILNLFFSYVVSALPILWISPNTLMNDQQVLETHKNINIIKHLVKVVACTATLWT